MSRSVAGRLCRGWPCWILLVGLGCGIQREGEGPGAIDYNEDSSFGGGSAGKSAGGAGGGGIAGAFGIAGASSTGGMSGSGSGGVAGSAGSSGSGGASGAGGGGPIDAGRDATTDAPSDTGIVDVSLVDASKDAPGDSISDAPRDTNADVRVSDASPRDSEASVDGFSPDVCVASGAEVCDGLDNDCNGSIEDPSACPTGCVGVAHLGKGYVFCYMPPARQDWAGAQAQCVGRGMHLVRVDDAAENQWIADTSSGLGYTGGIWLGANDRQTDGVWVWTDGVQFWQGPGDAGAPTGGLYNDWGPGQPNNNAQGGEACGLLELNGSWVWNDLGCNFVRAFLCER